MRAYICVGTRAGNVLLRKRIALADRQGNQLYDAQGRPRTWNLRTHRLDEGRMVSFVVPPGLADTKVCILRRMLTCPSSSLTYTWATSPMAALKGHFLASQVHQKCPLGV